MIKLTPGRLYKGMTLLIALWGFCAEGLRNRAAFASPPFLFSGMLSFYNQFSLLDENLI